MRTNKGHNVFVGLPLIEEGTHEQYKRALMESVAAAFAGFDGPFCEDPLCHRGGNHFVGEFGCYSNDRGVYNANGTVTMYKNQWGNDLPEPKIVPAGHAPHV